MGVERPPGACANPPHQAPDKVLPIALYRFRIPARRIGKALSELLASEAMLRVALPVYVERELDECAESAPRSLLEHPRPSFAQ